MPIYKGISAILARCHMKTMQKRAIPPLRHYLERVLRDMGGVSRIGPRRESKHTRRVQISSIFGEPRNERLLLKWPLVPLPKILEDLAL